MTYDRIESEKTDRNPLKWNKWPDPINWVTDIKVLVCNADTWMAQVDFAFAAAFNFWWTSFFPSPREVERKFFTGSYRCGFILNVKVKSPIEIIFGRGTNRVLAEITGPFTTGVFYWWVQQTFMGALSTWTSVLFPQLFCEDAIGDGLRRADHGTIGQGFNSGVPGLGVYVFDHYDFMSLTTASANLPMGYYHVYAAWLVHASGDPIHDLQLGLGLDGQPYKLSGAQDTTPGLPLEHVTEETGFLPLGGVLAAWMQGSKDIGSFPTTVECVRFVYSWSPFPFPPNGFGDLDNNHPHGPRPPALCGEGGAPF